MSSSAQLLPRITDADASDRPSCAPGQLEIVRCIGRGGYGSVYEARHAVHGRVAMKLAEASGSLDGMTSERLLRESQLNALVIHPNVMRTFEFGVSDRGPFLVMELLRGDDLAVILERTGALSVPVACEIVRQTLSALEAVHAVGIVHRDMKPSNLVLDVATLGATPRVKLIDFGVARSADAARLTQTGTVVGTPQYVAPEQIRNSVADARSDLWAVGMIFFELLAAQGPFDRASVHETLGAILFVDIPDVREICPDVPDAVARVLMGALRRDPAERWQSARIMLDALEAATKEAGLVVGPDTLDALPSYVEPPPLSVSDASPHASFHSESGIRRVALAVTEHADRPTPDVELFVASERRKSAPPSVAQAPLGVVRSRAGKASAVGFAVVAYVMLALASGVALTDFAYAAVGAPASEMIRVAPVKTKLADVSKASIEQPSVGQASAGRPSVARAPQRSHHRSRHGFFSFRRR